MYSLAKIGMGMSSLQLDGKAFSWTNTMECEGKRFAVLDGLYGLDSPKGHDMGWTAKERIWAGQPKRKWAGQPPKEYGLDSPKEMDWIAPKKGYGLDRPKEYGLDSSKERVWAGQPQGKGMGWTVQKNMVWIDPKEYGLDSPKEMGWTATKRIWAG